ncbi:MAG: TiaS agmantine-binding domain-containing protein [Nitrososphaeria archaeon]
MTEEAVFSVGIDDTDSPKGMCTTYVMFTFVNRAIKLLGAHVVGMPRLVRLNPACPWKTRGNASLGVDLALKESQLERLREVLVDTIFDLSEIDELETNPAFVVFRRSDIDERIRNYAREAVKRLVNPHVAAEIAKKKAVFSFGFNGWRGIVGAISGAAYDFPSGYTYELIAYRTKEYRGTPRRVLPESVFLADRALESCTFDNVDYENNEVKITPHTPCPVLLGIRGIDVACLRKALDLLEIKEPVEGFIVYKTNQATDDHIIAVERIRDIEPLTSVSFKAEISDMPRASAGGHVFVYVTDGENKIRVAAYEPTRGLRHVLLSLRPGDIIRVWGSYKPREGEPPTINLEKIEVIKIGPYGRLVNPICPVCGTRMKSEGKGKGYECPRCKFRTKDASKILELERRELIPGIYDVPPKARRHLSRPSFLNVIKDEGKD